MAALMLGLFRRRREPEARRTTPPPPPPERVCRTCSTADEIRVLVSHAGWHPVSRTFQRPGDGYLTVSYNGNVFYPAAEEETIRAVRCFHCGDQADSLAELLRPNPALVDATVDRILA